MKYGERGKGKGRKPDVDAVYVPSSPLAEKERERGSRAYIFCLDLLR